MNLFAQPLSSLAALALVAALGVTPAFAQDATGTGSQPAETTDDSTAGQNGAAASEGEGEPLTFTHVLDDEPLEGVMTPREGEEFTEAVDEFHMSGENPYNGQDEAIADGQDLYNQWCQACHMRDGSGRMGPALNDEEFRYERAATDKGLFEIIFGGAAGAMQGFGERMTQDEILRVVAFVESLRTTADSE